MELEKRSARASIPDREWIELEIQIDSNSIVQEATFRAFGCHHLLESSAKFVKGAKKTKLNELHWDGLNHWDILIEEVILKLKGEFQLPITEEELCHCRKIPTAKVDNAIVLGAQTPEKVRAWTSASSGCGTCRPNVEKIISYRTGKVS
jgi:bacterioferritin-associated ferredoxin